MSEEMWNIGILKELEKRSAEVSHAKVLIGVVEEIAHDASILLNRISDTFLEYTLHEKTHSLNILRIMDRIIPKKTLEQMNELELTILILSAFLHDIGMVVSRQRKEEILRSEKFNHFKEEYPRISNSLKKAQEERRHRIATQIEDQLLTFYLRKSHAAIGAEYIKKKFAARLRYRNSDFSGVVRAICRSHAEPWQKLGVRREEDQGYALREEYPTSYTIGNLKVNVQFLAIALRIADILDFDRERTPYILFEYLYPISEISLKHWLAHLSVHGWLIEEDKIEYEWNVNTPCIKKLSTTFLIELMSSFKELGFSLRNFQLPLQKNINCICLWRLTDPK